MIGAVELGKDQACGSAPVLRATTADPYARAAHPEARSAHRSASHDGRRRVTLGRVISARCRRNGSTTAWRNPAERRRRGPKPGGGRTCCRRAAVPAGPIMAWPVAGAMFSDEDAPNGAGAEIYVRNARRFRDFLSLRNLEAATATERQRTLLRSCWPVPG